MTALQALYRDLRLNGADHAAALAILHRRHGLDRAALVRTLRAAERRHPVGFGGSLILDRAREVA